MGNRVPWAFRHDLPVESDEQLTDRARGGDPSAFGELYRRHRKAAESTAWCLLRSKNDADDIVADAFAGVLSALRNGSGPRDNFRRYLLACVRNGCRVRRARTVPLQESSVERLAPVLEDPERFVEADTVARAFSSLAPRWQHTLWLTEVEQRPAHEVSERMCLSPNATAALAHRARQAFATAYLAEHVGSVHGVECVKHAPLLAAYVRGSLAQQAATGVEHHVVMCRECAAATADLRDLNASLRSLIPPVHLIAAGAAATGAAAAGTAGTLTTATATTATATTATATTTFTAATGGLWASFTGAGMLVKGLVAVVLIAPAIRAEPPTLASTGGASSHWVAVASQPDRPQALTETRPAAGTPPRGEASVAAVAGESSETQPTQSRQHGETETGTPATGVEPDIDARDPGSVDPVPVDDAVVLPVDDLPVGAVPQPIVDPAIQAAIVPIVAPIVEPIAAIVEPLVEPIVDGLDEALATMGLGSIGETVSVLRSLVPLLDGPLVDLVVDGLVSDAPDGASDPTSLTTMLNELPLTGVLSATDADAPSTVTPQPAPAADAGQTVVAPPLPAGSGPLLATLPTTPPVSLPIIAISVPSIGTSPVVLPGITVPGVLDIPSVEIPGLAIPAIDLSLTDLSRVDLPVVDLSALDLPLGIPPLTLPAGSQ